MTATLPTDPDTQRLARKLAADAGRPVEAVVRDAIEAHAVKQAKIADLRATLDASIARGGGLTLEEVTQRANAHLDRLNQTPSDG